MPHNDDSDTHLEINSGIHNMFREMRDDMARKLYRDEMHEKHPDLKEAWERYEILYRLYKKNIK